MRPFNEGESFYNVIKTAIPDFVEADYPLFIEFVTAYIRFLERKRTFVNKAVFPDFGVIPGNAVMATDLLGGPLYESRKMLEYRDVASTLDEFKAHFLDMFGNSFPNYSYVSLDLFITAMRQFYSSKGANDSIKWFFRSLFNSDAEVYFPRTDVLKASDGTWFAPKIVKVSVPTDGHRNSDVGKFYIGQRVQTASGSAQVESVVSYIVGQAFNQNITVNELTLKFGSLLGTFNPGETLVNIDSTEQVRTLVLPQITDVLVNAGGSNYQIGDVVSFSEGPAGGYGYQAFGFVSKVSNTAINGVAVEEGGDGYITGLPCTFTSTTGTGATAVIQDIYYGDLLLEDSSGYLALEEQTPDDSSRFQLEDVNVLFLELIIDPFCNAVANVVLTNPDYGAATGVAQLNGVNFDSAIEIAMAATDNKPFMNPWVFTGSNVATLANASAVLSLVTNTSFSNGVSVYRITDYQDLTSNLTNASVAANVIVAEVKQGGLEDTLYLKDFTGLNQFDTNLLLKQAGNGVLQSGTVTCDGGTSNVVGTGTSFTLGVRANTHVRLQNGTQFVVRTVVNNTFLTVFTAFAANVVANTFGILPVGTVTSVTPQAQRFYGKIRSIRLTQNGSNYQTPPTVTADSVSARAQELFYLEPGVDLLPGTPDDSIVAAADRIRLFTSAQLRARQDSGQVTTVQIVNSGVNYLDANGVQIIATHGTPRVGTDAELAALTGGVFQSQGLFTTSRSFLSADKFLQDASFYNDYTYVIRVSESFDHYKDLLLHLLHPAGFKALGQFVAELERELIVPLGTLEIRRPGVLPLDLLIGPYIPVQIQNFPPDQGGEL